MGEIERTPMGRDRSKKKDSVVFNPPKDYPTASKILTGAFLLQVVWVLYFALESNVLPALGTYTLLVGLAIVVVEWSALKMGAYVSTGLLRNPPFDNPLAVPITAEEIAKANGETSKTMTKFKSQFWQLLIHAAMAALETLVLQQVAEVAGGDLFAEPWRCSLFEQPNPPLLDTVYLVQLAVWIVTAVCHIWAFEPQSDYFIMLAHHIVTIGLVGISYQNGFVRFGLMVLWIHDISDIPIDLLKLTNYLKLEDMGGFFLVEISFFSTMATWLWLRLYLYPVQVIYNACYFGYCNIIMLGATATFGWEAAYCPTEHHDKLSQTLQHWTWLASTHHGEEAPYPKTAFWALSTVVLLSVLLVMHVWWYFLFLRILKGIITSGSGHEAGRQQYEGDDETDSAAFKAAKDE